MDNVPDEPHSRQSSSIDDVNPSHGADANSSHAQQSNPDLWAPYLRDLATICVVVFILALCDALSDWQPRFQNEPWIGRLSLATYIFFIPVCLVIAFWADRRAASLSVDLLIQSQRKIGIVARYLIAIHVLALLPMLILYGGLVPTSLKISILVLAMAWGFVLYRSRQRLAAAIKTKIRRDKTRCYNCGYDLHQLTQTRCPECGQPFTAEQIGILRHGPAH